MSNRILVIILGILVLSAIIWRTANPPAPPIPGPLGAIPSWTSSVKVGDMTASAISPDGTKWAGAWNNISKSGSSQSAIHIIDLVNSQAQLSQLPEKCSAASLGWKDDKTIWALQLDAKDQPKIVFIDATNGEPTSSKPPKAPVTTILTWPAGSDKFVANLGSMDNGVKVAVVSEAGDVIGKEVTLNLPKDTKIGQSAAMSKDGKQFVFSVSDGKGGCTYYLANSEAGTAKPAFTLEQLPGKVEGLWVSDAGVLIACSEFEKLKRVVYNPATGKIEDMKAIDLKNWHDAPKNMMFVAYSGGYGLDLASGKVSRLFDYKDLSRDEDRWRREVQGGRLYPRKDGGYTSISVTDGTVDIRILDKDGVKPRNLLARH